MNCCEMQSHQSLNACLSQQVVHIYIVLGTMFQDLGQWLGYLRLVATRPATTHASRGSAVKLTQVKKIAEAISSTTSGFPLHSRGVVMTTILYMFMPWWC